MMRDSEPTSRFSPGQTVRANVKKLVEWLRAYHPESRDASMSFFCGPVQINRVFTDSDTYEFLYPEPMHRLYGKEFLMLASDIEEIPPPSLDNLGLSSDDFVRNLPVNKFDELARAVIARLIMEGR